MISVVIIRVDDVIRRRGYCDHFDTMYICGYVCACVRACVCGRVGVYVSTIKRKPLIEMT